MGVLNKDLRAKIIIKGRESGLVHYSSALSCVDFLQHLYFSRMQPEDIFILSKGHAAMALYSVLEAKGYKPAWQMHPDFSPSQGIYATSGSLGHGLPIATGYALAKKLQDEKGRVYVLVGDGEISEGSNWEALAIASRHNLNLTVAIDWNKHQIAGDPKEVLGITSGVLEKRLSAFGCKTLVIGGHETSEFRRIDSFGETGLQGIILDTIPGKGIKYLEMTQPHHFDWDKNSEEYLRALEDLK